jgi:hypothetical protein
MIAELSRGMTTSGLDANPYFHGAAEFQSGTDDVGFTAGDLIRRQDAVYSSP